MSTKVYKPGQVVWLVLSFKSNPRAYATNILKVGRKWVTLDHGGFRFDSSTGLLDGGGYSPPGKVYESRGVYEAELSLGRAWDALCSELCHRNGKPSDLTLERIAQARELLGLGAP